MRTTLAILSGALLFAGAAQAEVKSSGPNGFAIENKAVVAARPAEVFDLLARPSAWWNPAHSYTGNAGNMTLDLRPGGCFCEREAAGGGIAVEHARILFVQPGTMLRMQGGLGPLQEEGSVGTLTWKLRAVEGGTEVTQLYVVGGYIRGGAERLAPAVDRVLAEQLERLSQAAGR